MQLKRFVLVCSTVFMIHAGVFAQHNDNPFRQLGQLLPAPNAFRTGSGMPGPSYWQQQADYTITVELDEDIKRIKGKETITYHNNSPDVLHYLWVQLDQNIRARQSLSSRTSTQTLSGSMRTGSLQYLHRDFDGGFNIHSVRDKNGRVLSYTVVETMMRIDLPTDLRSGKTFVFQIEWDYLLNERYMGGGRSGYHENDKDSTLVFAIAQFFPRMAVYDDVNGWRHKQFFGSGEFALPFGNYQVKITVPADYVVAATGTLQNSSAVLSPKQKNQLALAGKSFQNTVMVVDEEEAVVNGQTKSTNKKTWIFNAENVRDFAFAASRNFIWDAMAVDLNVHTPLAMSFYTADGNPLWEKYSTKALAHGMRIFSDFTITYPYPKAVSVMTGRGGGMEYPMLAFNGGKPNSDSTYFKWQRNGLVGVVIHEFGHNIFPMIVNSDERQWGWMDEGMNSFVEYLAEEAWDRSFNSGDGPAYSSIRDRRMDERRGIRLSPIMTACDIDQTYAYNAYNKASAGLNILRETILGRELFDFAFKEYVERWKFKHPMPADFFRTMEDASGVDLDWFWRGWFFTTDAVDLAIDKVQWYQIRKADETVVDHRIENYITKLRNNEAIAKTAIEQDTTLLDLYDNPDYVSEEAVEYKSFLDKLTDEQKKLLAQDYNYYQIDIKNNDGMIMPVILKFVYEDGSEELHRIPAEIWQTDNRKVSKVFFSKKRMKQILLDPYYETADCNINNNEWNVTGRPELITLSNRGRYRR
ncbi:M1 family metallopeptidase [bacterium]|nr:M1 family metallopeptidase [bacterium]